MADENKGHGAFNTGPLDAGPEQGGSNLGGLGSTGALDRDRDPEAEGLETKKPVTSARDELIVEEEEGEVRADGESRAPRP